MKKYIVLMSIVAMFPLSASALTQDQVNSIVTLLRVFNVNAAVIVKVETTLQKTVPTLENPTPVQVTNPVVLIVPQSPVQIQTNNQPLVTPPINPIIGDLAQPIQVSIGSITPYSKENATWFSFDKDVFIKYLKIKVVNVKQSETSNLRVHEVNLEKQGLTPGGWTSINNPNGQTEFTLNMNSFIKPSDKFRLFWGGGSVGIGNYEVYRMDLMIIGAESEATINGQPVILPDLTIRLVNNEL